MYIYSYACLCIRTLSTTGVFAVRAGPPLTRNLRRALLTNRGGQGDGRGGKTGKTEVRGTRQRKAGSGRKGLQRVEDDLDLEEWEPQSDFLGIISTGVKSNCVASRGDMAIEVHNAIQNNTLQCNTPQSTAIQCKTLQ